MFEFLVWATGIAGFSLAIAGYRMSRDVFHPVLFIAPMLAFSYWLAPLVITRDETIWRLLPRSQMVWVQTYYLLGVICFCAGTLMVGVPKRRIREWIPSPEVRRQLRRAGLLLGALGVGAYVYMVSNVGGLEATYGRAHGRGAASSGYVREAFFLIIPALLLLLLSNSGRKVRAVDRWWILAIAAPLAFHGFISASRGPSFMVLVTLAVGGYMVRHRRPPLLVASGGLGAVGILMLLLVTHRKMIHLGSENFEFKGIDAVVEFVGRPTPGNEYVLGSGVVIDASIRGDYQWGARYVIQTVIRAIPRQIWPSQYEDSARFFGISGIRMDDLGDLSRTLGWSPTEGASMGLLPDVWKQFSWGSLLLLLILGWAHGHVWRRAVSDGGIWMMGHVLLLALSIFTTQQTLQAMLFRVMFLGGVGWLIWFFMVRGTWRRTMFGGAGAEARIPAPVRNAPSRMTQRQVMTRDAVR